MIELTVEIFQSSVMYLKYANIILHFPVRKTPGFEF